MNPLSLLTKGHTFGNVKDRRGAYKVSARYVLPKFSGSKIPSFAPRPPAKALQTALFEPPRPAVAAAVPPKRDVAVPITPKVMAKPEVKPSLPGIWSRAVRWWEQFLPQPQTWTKPAPSVQTELSLNKVTVVRNDLSEDDLMVVMVEKKTRQPGASAEPVRLMANP